MTEKEWEIFYKLLIDLFVEKPGQKQNIQRSKDYENVTTGTLLTAACRNLEPGDKIEECEPIHKT